MGVRGLAPSFGFSRESRGRTRMQNFFVLRLIYSDFLQNRKNGLWT